MGVGLQQPTVIGGAEDSNPGRTAQRADELCGACTGYQDLCAIRRDPRGPATIAFCYGDDRGVAARHSPHHLMVRLAGLEHEAPTGVARSQQASRSCQQRHRLFHGSLAGRKKFLIKVQESHNICGFEAVQHRFGSDHHSARRFCRRRHGDLVDCLADKRLQFFPGPRNPCSEVLQAGVSAKGAYRRAHLAAVR